MKRHLISGSARRMTAFCLLAGAMMTSLLAQAPAISAETQPPPQQRKAAVFVFSREPKIGVQQSKILEDLVAARVAKLGFATLTRDVVVDSISKAMRQPGIEMTERDKSLCQEFASAVQNPEKVDKSLEQQLDEQSSVMRLAQTIGADLIVIPTIESFGTEKRVFKGNELAPVATTSIFNNLLVSYRLAFAASGGAVAGDSVRVSRAWRESESLTRETDDLLNSMFDEAATQLAAKITVSNHEVKEVPKVDAVGVQFNIKPVLPGGTPLQLPSYESNDVKLSVSVTVAADVTMDGVSVGSVPGNLRFATGLHQILIQAEGFKPWKRFVTISEGQKFDILLEMTPEGYDKWKEIITFLSDLSRKTKLTDAEVKQMEAKADAMRKAGLIVTVGDNGVEMIRK
ncbi:MAG: PEGA domain-containing protein [Verrucomicrobiota bacterium]